MASVAYEVWRVEDRTDPDAVDFWDFTHEKSASVFLADLQREDSKSRKYNIRMLSDKEIIIYALLLYYDTIKDK